MPQCQMKHTHSVCTEKQKAWKTEAQDAKVAFAWRLPKCFQIGLTTLQTWLKDKRKKRNEMHFHSKCRYGNSVQHRKWKLQQSCYRYRYEIQVTSYKIQTQLQQHTNYMSSDLVYLFLAKRKWSQRMLQPHKCCQLAGSGRGERETEREWEGDRGNIEMMSNKIMLLGWTWIVLVRTFD